MERFWEIDFFRGLAVLMMVAFHFLYDLNYFAVTSIPVNEGYLFWFARITAGIFIFISGICLSVSYSKKKDKYWKKSLRRFTKLFGLGLIITAITWLFFPQEFIVFGILHFFGLSAVIILPFLRFKKSNIILGLIFIAIGIFLSGIAFDFPYLLWLGLEPVGFLTFDYFPIFPWFGLLLIGLFAGKKFYVNKTPKIRNNVLTFIGRHSLLIYFLHQPVLIGIIFLLN